VSVAACPMPHLHSRAIQTELDERITQARFHDNAQVDDDSSRPCSSYTYRAWWRKFRFCAKKIARAMFEKYLEKSPGSTSLKHIFTVVKQQRS
jgi:hypothetical protein